MVPKANVDLAHSKATSHEDTHSESCPFCPCLTSYSIGGVEEVPSAIARQKRHRVFHSRRSEFQNETEVDALCLFCQHLDPGHLFGEFRQRHMGRFDILSILLGTLAELEARTQCDFCRIVVCTIRAHAASYRAKEEPISGDRPITISFGKRRYYPITLSFDKGPMCHLAIEKCFKEDQLVGTSIPWKKIRRWINCCSTQHTNCLPSTTTVSGMRFIDVIDRKVTPELSTHESHTFVALSYVWGKNIDPRICVLLKENTTQLEQTNGLETLPKTIEDAMKICEKLGQRFLWVDRLCIVQDDETKKGHQIHAMADIFQSAVLTIIAVCGGSMESPIPGVGTQRQTFQSQMDIPGLQVASALPRLSRTLAGSVWSTRGWTYQEAVLSSRKLYFTDLEVWFTCNHGFEREDASLQTRSLIKDIRQKDIYTTQLRGYNSRSQLEDYWRHLEEYTKRSLTYKSDIYNAFTGILTVLFGEEKTIYGLPELYLDAALLWRLNGDVSTWDIRDCTVGEQHLLCPSWAWSSIDGAVRDGVRIDISRDYVISLVPWSIVDEDGNVRTIDIKFEKRDDFMDDFMDDLYLAFAWRGGCFEAALPGDLQEMLESDRRSLYRWAMCNLPRRWPTRKEFWDEVRSRGSPEAEVPLTMLNDLRPGMLLTRTQTAVLRYDLSQRSPTRKESRKTVRSGGNPETQVPLTSDLRLGFYQKDEHFEHFEILNQRGDVVGVVEANELCLKSRAERKQRLKTKIHHLMALSLSEESFLFRPRGKESKIKIKGRSYHYEQAILDSIMVRVLLISWDENVQVARRVSMGWVYLNAWAQTKRTWKTVVLE